MNFPRLTAYLIVVSVYYLAGCTIIPTTPVPVPSAQPSAAPSPVGNYPVQGWDQRYTDYIKANVTDVMINSDPFTLICPGYSRAQGREIWAAIIQADSYAECGWDRTQDYVENFIDSTTGKKTISSGLLQMSLSDDQYEGCHFKTQAGTHDPILNLECGIKTMTHMISSHPGATVYGALSHYWSSFDPDMDDGEGFCTMRKKLKQTYPSCKTVTGDCE